MPKRIVIQGSLLRRLVVDEGMTQAEVGARIGASVGTVRKLCRIHGVPTPGPGPRSGERHPGWKGGFVVRKGYLYQHFPEHPFSTKSGYVLVHRLAMERRIGRHLRPDEVVHHLNRDRMDNRIENLFLFPSNGHHLRHELAGCPIHALACSTGHRESAIREALERGDVAILSACARGRRANAARRAALVRRACAALDVRVPPPFENRPTTSPDRLDEAATPPPLRAG